MSAAPVIPASDQATRLRKLVESGEVTVTLPLRTTRRARIITISSGKGGVGKTNLAVNLAIALQSRAVRTTLLDLDYGLANADLLCGLNPATRVDRALATDTPLDDLAVLAPGGFRLIPGAVGLARSGSENDLLARLPELDATADALILDTGAGMGPLVRSALRVADLALLVATPEPTSIADAYALLKVACQSAPNAQFSPMLVINQCASAEEAHEVHQRINAVANRFLGRDLPLLCTLPTDPCLPLAVRARRPLLLSSPQSPAAAAVTAAANAVISRLNLESEPPQSPPREPHCAGVWDRIARLLAGRID